MIITDGVTQNTTPTVCAMNMTGLHTLLMSWLIFDGKEVPQGRL
jgi:hypothetical protein